MPPLSRWILLVPDEDASCHLGGRGGACRSSEPACTACCHKKVAAGSVHPGSHGQPRWQASEHGVASNAADNSRMHARTFRLCAPFSSSQLLVLVVCAALTADTVFMMTRSLRCCSFRSERSKNISAGAAPRGTCTHVADGCSHSRGMGCAEQARPHSAYRTQLHRPSARRTGT